MSESLARRGMLHARGIAALVAALSLAAGSALLAPAANAVAAATITLDVTPDEATEGDTLVVTATATGTSDLYAYDLIFAFDPELLAFDEDSASGPDGGFTAVSVGDGFVALTHTRLGTSPGLAGVDAIELGSFSFTALGGGDTTIALASAELVSATDGSVTLTDVDEAPVALVALPEPPAPTTTPTPTASSSVVPAPSASAGAAAIGSTRGRPLAATGADAAPWLVAGAAGIALVAVGVLLVIRRRQAVSE
jgi:LPXTG-motif cell wall-anchored protein